MSVQDASSALITKENWENPSFSTEATIQNTPCLSFGSGKTISRQQPAQQIKTAQRVYKSCDFCTKRKRRCDGDGVMRCRFVIRAST